MDGSTPLLPDRAIAEAFVTALTGAPDGVIRLRFIHDADRKMPAHECEGTLDQVWPAVVGYQARGYATFFLINEAAPGPGSGYAGMTTDRDITRVRFLGIDADGNIPDELTEHATRSLTIYTSIKDGMQRGQVLWGVSDCTVEQFRGAQERLARHYGTDPSVVNPSRVFRLPGSLHQKRSPQLVTFERGDGKPQPLAALLSGISELPPRKPRSEVDHQPVYLDHVAELIDHVQDYPERPEWVRFIASVRGTYIIDDPEQEAVLELLLAKSRTGWPRWNEEIDYPKFMQVWETLRTDKEDGAAHYGTLWHLATKEPKGGPYKGPPGGTRPAAEAFREFKERTEAEHQEQAEREAREEAERQAESAKWGEDDFDPAAAKPKDGTEWKDNPRIRMMHEREVFAMPPPVPLIDGVLMEGERVAIIGPPKTGKTFLALDLTYSLAASLERATNGAAIKRPGPVLYCTAEGLTGFSGRMKAWRQEHGITEDTPFIFNPHVPSAEGEQKEGREFMRACIAKCGGEVPVAVVIDTLALSLGALNENESATANRFFAVTTGMREEAVALGKPAPAIIVIGHAIKKEPEVLRGTGNFDAGWDVQWVVRINSESGTLCMRCKLFKDVKRGGPFYFRLKEIDVEGYGLAAALVTSTRDDFQQRRSGKLSDRDAKRFDLYNYLAGIINIRNKRCWLDLDALVDGRMIDTYGFEPKDGTPEQHEWHKKRKVLREQYRNGSRKRHPNSVPLYAGMYEDRPIPGRPGEEEVRFGLPEEGSAADAKLRAAWFEQAEPDMSADPIEPPGGDDDSE
jgi:hypothetical protein